MQRFGLFDVFTRQRQVLTLGHHHQRAGDEDMPEHELGIALQGRRQGFGGVAEVRVKLD